MPGTFVFKPIEANLTHNTEWFGKMDPYCAFVVGDQRINSGICKKGGKHPHWNDALTIPINTTQSKMTVELKDKDTMTSDDQIGSFMVDLNEIEQQGKISKWYPLYHKNKQAGEVLLQSSFEGGSSLLGKESYGLTSGLATSEQYKQQAVTTSQTGVYSHQHELPLHDQSHRTFVEQRQTVEPHTFMKEVDVVETRPVMKEIEVLESHKVMKEVQYTEAVPVKKHIETIEPKVVMKDVEVMEPRLVTKQIQVIENVPVMKHVEVIESIPVMREIDTFEPQTYTKTVEVMEQVPVRKQVTVTEPYTMKKAVEFVEPIITTKTITKEVIPEVIIDEKITTEIGPASVIGYSTESRESSYLRQSGDVRLTEEQRYSQNILPAQQTGYSSHTYEKNILPAQQTGYSSHTYEKTNLEGQKAQQGYSSTYQQMGLGGEQLSGQHSTLPGQEQIGGPYSNLFNKDKEKDLYKKPKY